MQIIVFIIIAGFCSFAAVFGTEQFRMEKRGRKRNLLLAAAGIPVCFLFAVLAEAILKAGRPDFYYFTHRPGAASLKIFAAACLCWAFYYALVLMLSERKKQVQTVWRWLFRSFLIGVCTAVVLEIGFFNFRHFELIGANAPEMSFSSDRIWEQGFYFNRASWKFHPYGEGGGRKLVFYPAYHKVRNVHFEFDDGNPRTLVRIGFNDEAHRGYELIPDHEFIRGVSRSYNVPLHTVGTTYSIEVGLPDPGGLQDSGTYGISLPAITINKVVPLSIDPVRFCLTFLAVFLISAFFPGSPLWALPLNFKSFPQMAAIAGLLCLFMAFFLWTVFSSYICSDSTFSEQKAAVNGNYQQYNKLVEALMVPRYALIDIPNHNLEQLDDPYDLRQREGKTSDYLWDTAYYNNSYYVYFGVVPAVAVLLPYRLLTGDFLELDYPILGFSCLFAAGLYGIYAWIVKRFFNRISFGVYWTGLILLLTPLNIVWCLRRTLVYELAITSGICFAAWGIFFILLACDAEKWRPLLFFLSGTCASLAVGCRPTMIFISLVVFTAAVFRLKQDGSFFSGRNVRDAVLLLIPYVLVAAALMKYNAERFGDPFEFGITYQLTTENRASGHPLLGFYGRALSVLSSLFTFPVLDMNFPFIHLRRPALPYNGVILNGDMILGVFSWPQMILLFGLPFLRKRLKEKGQFLWIFCLSCLIAGAAVCVTASGFAIANRYLTDYLYLAALPAVIVLFCLFEKCEAVGWLKPAQAAGVVMSLISVCLVLAVALTGEDDWLRLINPLYFDKLRYAFSPWL